jgi:hypothetical protein
MVEVDAAQHDCDLSHEHHAHRPVLRAWWVAPVLVLSVYSWYVILKSVSNLIAGH